MGRTRRRDALRIALVLTSALTLMVAGVLIANPAFAAPTLTTSGPTPAVGALPVDPTISSPPNETFPTAPKLSTGCTFPNVTGPNGLVIKHVAPCQSGTGNGTAASPWRNIAQAMASLNPREVAYIHDDPNLSLDYKESNLRPGKDGTGAESRIRLMAAPGEQPWIGKSTATNSSTQPIFHLDRPWWLVHGLNLDGSGIALQTAVVRIGSSTAPGQAHHIVLRRLTSRNTVVPKAIIEFDGAQNSALLDSIDPPGTANPAGFGQPLDTNGRPTNIPQAGSGDFTDHHAITAKNGADKILIRNNESYGHNGDSFQCGEESSTARPVTSNITIENNRFHQDEENAVDLKACQGVTVRNNKMYGYRPARPYEVEEAGKTVVSSRAPQGDAIVAHSAESGRSADRLLIELNRFWDNSRGINISSVVPTVVVRRNLIFNASTAFCGIGAGMDIRAQNGEVYHNGLDNLKPPPPTSTPGPCGPRANWSASQKAALRLAQATTSRSVLWNNIVSNATYPYTQTSGLAVDANRNLFQKTFSGMPPNSLVGDPLYVSNPASNDYFTRQGSPARDAAAAVPSAVKDPRTYCDDLSPGETDILVEPDIGFQESCF
jgi:copper-binding protein NosD